MTDITSIFCEHNFFNTFHHHFSESLIIILQPFINFLYNFNHSNLFGQLNSCLNELLVVSFFNSHPTDPKTSKEFLEYILPNVSCFYTITVNNLLQNLENNFSHFLFRVFELPDDCWHHRFCILSSMF